MCKVTGIQISQRFPKRNAEKHFGDYLLIWYVSASAKVELLVTHQQKSLHLPTLHCTVIGFALDWESHQSLKHDCECLTELLECPFFNHVRFSESN